MEDFLLICPCGGETRLWHRSLGDVVQCYHCGAHLTVAEDNTRRLNSEYHESQPFTGGDEELEPGAELSEEAAGSDETATPEASAPALSPDEQAAVDDVALFLADEEERPKPAPEPMKGSAAPQVPSRPKIGPEDVATAKPKLETCNRCNRVFRGSWDRHETDYGVYCNICFNLVQDAATHAASTSTPPPTELHVELARQTSWTPYEDPQHRLEELEGERRRMYIGFAVVAGLVLLTILAMVIHSSPEVSIASEPVREISARGKQQLEVFHIAMQFLMQLAKNGVALYAILAYAKKLPNDELWKNVLVVSLVSIVIAGANMVPFVGGLIGLGIVYSLYNLDFGEIITYIVFRVLAGILVSSIATAIFGAVAISLL